MRKVIAPRTVKWPEGQKWQYLMVHLRINRRLKFQTGGLARGRLRRVMAHWGLALTGNGIRVLQPCARFVYLLKSYSLVKQLSTNRRLRNLTMSMYFSRTGGLSSAKHWVLVKPASNLRGLRRQVSRVIANANCQPRSISSPGTSSIFSPSYKPFSTTTIQMSSALKVISTANSAAPRAPYSQAIAVNGFIYCSGQVPMKPDGTLIVDDIKAAALQSLTNLKLVLEAGGSSIEKIFKVNVYLVDMADFAAVNEVYSEFFGTHRPARTCIAIKQLPLGATVEIECIAVE
ncbi:Endoribonuclease L-PSP/chorismate mutase-like protein [Lipomyces orientalis]|uniref:Endoribonuclease L-PSP/chorismate mutase-like protein n=1 Tax=Lipomyces orientalis TaxID=1233043 RepID=A0ACC3U123_9ASCO